jgi:hypothetical protein
MKRLILHSMFAAAALVAVAGSASAQILTAEIPFAFRANNVLMQPGSYEVVRVNSSNTVMYSLRNRDTSAAVLLSSYSHYEPSKAATAKLGFECVDNRCSLRELSTGGDSAYRFFAPKMARGETREIALSRNAIKAD